MTHLEGEDFSAVIAKAQALEGFKHVELEHFITIGFARNALMQAAPAVIDKVKAGEISHFFLVGAVTATVPSAPTTPSSPRRSAGQPAAHPGLRQIQVQQARLWRYRRHPRLLDVGQCNDAYSAIQLALALSEAFECGVNDLPLTLVLSWFEQKAIVILLTLLALGVKDIRTGPTAPAFLTPALLKVLEEQFGLKGTTTAEADLAEILAA